MVCVAEWGALTSNGFACRVGDRAAFPQLMFLTEKSNVFLLKGLIIAYSFQEIATAFYSAS